MGDVELGTVQADGLDLEASLTEIQKLATNYGVEWTHTDLETLCSSFNAY